MIVLCDSAYALLREAIASVDQIPRANETPMATELEVQALETMQQMGLLKIKEIRGSGIPEGSTRHLITPTLLGFEVAAAERSARALMAATGSPTPGELVAATISTP